MRWSFMTDPFTRATPKKTAKHWDNAISPRHLFIIMAVAAAIILAIAVLAIFDLLAASHEESGNPYTILDHNVQRAFDTQ